MKYLEIAYRYVWYYTQWWVKATHLRRPFTFVMRDNPWTFGVMSLIFGLGAIFSPLWGRILLAIVWAFIAGHVWWGSKILRGQQEEPTFDPLHPVRSVEAIREQRRAHRISRT